MRDIIPYNRHDKLYQVPPRVIPSRGQLRVERRQLEPIVQHQTVLITDVVKITIQKEVVEDEHLAAAPSLDTGSSANTSSVAATSVEPKEKEIAAPRRSWRARYSKIPQWLRRSFYPAMAVAVLAISSYVMVDTIRTNNQLTSQASANENGAGQSNAADARAQEGSDKTKPSAQSLGKYVVSSDLPRALYISKLNIAARVLPMSVNADGSVQAPVNIYDSGWYNGSVKPGEVGAVFIDGHSSGSTHEGLFGNLGNLAEGDTLQLEKGNGTKLTYKVVHTETIDLEAVDMKKVLLPYGNTLRGLNLMTCAGQWVNEGKTDATLNKRTIVFTAQVDT